MVGGWASYTPTRVRPPPHHHHRQRSWRSAVQGKRRPPTGTIGAAAWARSPSAGTSPRPTCTAGPPPLAPSPLTPHPAPSHSSRTRGYQPMAAWHVISCKWQWPLHLHACDDAKAVCYPLWYPPAPWSGGCPTLRRLQSEPYHPGWHLQKPCRSGVKAAGSRQQAAQGAGSKQQAAGSAGRGRLGRWQQKAGGRGPGQG